MIAAGALPRIVAAMDTHFSARGVQHAASVALWNVSEDRDCAHQIVSLGAVQRLCQTMDLFTRDAAVQLACCGALMNLAVDPLGKVCTYTCTCTCPLLFSLRVGSLRGSACQYMSCGCAAQCEIAVAVLLSSWAPNLLLVEFTPRLQC